MGVGRNDNPPFAVSSRVSSKHTGRGVRRSSLNHKLDTDELVRFYEQEFYVLSNFSSFRVFYRGEDFDTAEHAYQWSKFPHRPKIQEQIKTARSAHEAYKLAEENTASILPGWKYYREHVMRNILLAKVQQHKYVLKKLRETGTRKLVADSWRDDYWGWGPDCDGHNVLGRLWAEIRDTELYTV